MRGYASVLADALSSHKLIIGDAVSSLLNMTVPCSCRFLSRRLISGDDERALDLQGFRNKRHLRWWQPRFTACGAAVLAGVADHVQASVVW